MKGNKLKIFLLLIKLFKKLNKKRKLQILILFLIIVLSSISELISLATAFPFLELITNKGNINNLGFIENLLNLFGISIDQASISSIIFMFSFAAVFAALMKTFNLWIGNRLAAAIGSDLSSACFSRSLYQEYSQFIESNSNHLISTNMVYLNDVTDALGVAARFFTAFVISIFISVYLISFSFKSSLLAIVVFLTAYFLIAIFSRKRLINNSKIIAKNTEYQIQLMQESNFLYKDITLGSSQKKYLNLYQDLDFKRRISQAKNNFINLFPRNSIESLLLIFLAFLVYLSSRNNTNFNNIIPTIGTLAIGAQKLLPHMQQVYGSWSTLAGASASIINVLKMLDLPIDLQILKYKTEPLLLKKNIKMIDLSLKYKKSKSNVFSRINLEINKGEVIGIKGQTGSGKSSFINVLMGLIKPSFGKIEIDGLNIYENSYPFNLFKWRKTIAHVPQNIFLMNSSIAENIAFELTKEELNMSKVVKAAEEANLDSFIKNLPKGFETLVGENGVKLSGGQKQRIGIARALYKEASVLVFDEATSSLDTFTESKILKTIYSLRGDKTIFIISHRLETLEKCDQLIEFPIK